MATSRKKVIVRTTTGGLRDAVLPGYLPVSGLLAPDALSIDLLDLEGRIVLIPLESIHSIAFVRDFNLTDKVDPERLTRRTFLARPRSEGLWLRLTLAGDPTGSSSGQEIIEGLAPLDISLLDGLLNDRGLFLIPPDIRSNTQRLYIPRHAIVSLQLLAVITTPSKPKPAHPPTPQPSLFPDR